MIWKWSTGYVYYKSSRPTHNINSTNTAVYEYDTQQSAIKQSLEHDPFLIKMLI